MQFEDKSALNAFHIFTSCKYKMYISRWFLVYQNAMHLCVKYLPMVVSMPMATCYQNLCTDLVNIVMGKILMMHHYALINAKYCCITAWFSCYKIIVVCDENCVHCVACRQHDSCSSGNETIKDLNILCLYFSRSIWD